MKRRDGRGLFRGVYSALVNDLDFQRLTPAARHLLLTMRVSEQAGPACIFRCYRQMLEEQTGYPAETVQAALTELSTRPRRDAPWIYVDGPVIWIRNGLRHDPTMNLGDPKHIKAVIRAVSALPHVPIVATFCRYYGITRAIRRAIEGPSKTHRIPSGVSETETESDSETDTETESESDARATLGDLGTRNGPGGLTTPTSDSESADGDAHRRCPVCRHEWLGAPRCPKEASHGSIRAARPVAG